MDNNQNQIALTELVRKNESRINVLEKIAILTFALGFVFYYLKLPNNNIILIIGSILTAISYFLFAFKIVETQNIETTGLLNSKGMINFLYKLMYFSISISAIAILGLVISFNNTNSLIITGGLTLFIVLFLSLITKLNDRTRIYNSIFYIRIVTCLLLLTYLAITINGF